MSAAGGAEKRKAEGGLGPSPMVTDASASDPSGKGGKNGKGKGGHGAAPY